LSSNITLPGSSPQAALTPVHLELVIKIELSKMFTLSHAMTPIPKLCPVSLIYIIGNYMANETRD